MMTRLIFKNIIKRPSRSLALLILSAFLSFSVFGGSAVVSSMQNGLTSLESRLGADIIAVPDKAAHDLEAILIQGTPGYFYMDKTNIEKIEQIEGVETVSPQYFLATLSAGCCSVPVQVIGFDPETDFSIQPWIKESYGKNLGTDELIAGANINAGVGENLKFYDHICRVVGKLEKTGTQLDNAVYADGSTVKILMSAAKEMGVGVLEKNDPEKLISSVLIKVQDGADIDSVSDYINIHLRHVTAVRTQNMISGLSQSLIGISEMTKILMAAIWVLSLIIMAVAFSMIINERKREFAVLRVIGASRGRLAVTVLCEAAVIGMIGGLLGVIAGCIIIFSFEGVMSDELGMPYLVPNMRNMLQTGAAAILSPTVAGLVTSAFSAVRISRIDTGLILREGN